MRDISIAWFECNSCRHRCTAPESINAIPHQMETYETFPPIVEEDKEKKTKPMLDEGERTERKSDIEAFHAGNTCTIKTVGDNVTVVRMARSYAKATHDKTELAESDHITLSCPECNAQLYEVQWGNRKRR